MNYRKSFWLMWALCVVGLLLLYLFVAVGHIAIAYAGVLCMLAGLGQTVKFFRCPYCGKLWRLRGGFPRNVRIAGRKSGDSYHRSAELNSKNHSPSVLKQTGSGFMLEKCGSA